MNVALFTTCCNVLRKIPQIDLIRELPLSYYLTEKKQLKHGFF